MALGGGGIKIPKKEKEKEKEKSSRFISKTEMIIKSKITLNIIMLTPFILLSVSAMSCYITQMNYTFILLSNIFGYSLLTNFYFLFYSYKHNFCMYSKISIYTLILLNMLNITHLIFDLGSLYNLYDQIIAFAGIVLASIFAIKEIK